MNAKSRKQKNFQTKRYQVSNLLTAMEETLKVDENATFEAAGAPLPNDEVQGPLKSLTLSEEPSDLASSSVDLWSNDCERIV